MHAVRLLRTFVTLFALLLVAACGSSVDSAAVPTAVPEPTATTPPAPTASPAATPTATPQPTSTPPPVATSSTAVPIVTPEAEPAATTTPLPGAERATHTALFGQPITLPGGEQLTVTTVLEDSRCPADVQCVWEGELIVGAVWLSAENVTTDLVLTWAYHAEPTLSPDGKYLVGIWDVRPEHTNLRADVAIISTGS